MDNLFLQNGVALAPVETKRASEVIFEQIREMILSGQLKPGDRLPSEKSLMEMLKRSRPTVREALRMLEHAGFIRTIPGSNGAVVQQPNTQDVEQTLDALLRYSRITVAEMAEYREITDVTVAKWAAERRTAEDVRAIDALLARAETLTGQFDEFIKLDIEFNGLVARAAKSEMAYLITRVLDGYITRAMSRKAEDLSDKGRLAMCSKVQMTHRTLANAIANGDGEGARNIMAIHLRMFRQDLIEKP